MRNSSLFILLLFLAAHSVQATPGDPRQDPFLEEVQRRTLRYFIDTTPVETGLAPDRYPSPGPSSIAAAGYALTAFPIAVEHRMLTRAQAAERTVKALRFFRQLTQHPQAEATTFHKGFYYHFLKIPGGEREWNCELSNMDTALLIMGALFCQGYFDGQTAVEEEIRALADSLYFAADWNWFMNGRETMSMGWRPEEGFNKVTWTGYMESMILYILGLGSPTHPLPDGVWDAWCSTYIWAGYYGQEFISFGPLFGHQFSHVWIDFRGIQDSYMREKGIDYSENSRRAALSQRAYAIANPGGWRDYGENIWGFTASDGPLDGELVIDGVKRRFSTYSARGVSFDWVNDDGTIAPYAAGSSMPFAPEICIPALKEMRRRYGAKLWQKYGFLDAFNPTYREGAKNSRGWFNPDYLGIDQGPMLAMIENYRTGLIWRVLAGNPHLRRGLHRAGFSGGWLDASPLDEFGNLEGWKSIAADGVTLRTSMEESPEGGSALRLDFNFVAGGGYCGVQKHLPITLPENFQFTFRIRGEAPDNNLEFKLLDAGGDNVWWHIKRNYHWPRDWSTITIRKRHIDFAWGPASDRTLRRMDKLEFMISSSSGGKGSIWIDDLSFQALPPEQPATPQEIAAAALRRDLGFFETPDSFYSALAREEPVGLYPRYCRGEQSYWTVVGVNNARQEALINSDGMVEVDKGRFSIEPFLAVDDTLYSWHEASSSASLAGGCLPLPRVEWEGLPLQLTVKAFADGLERDDLTAAGSGSLYLTYTVSNYTPHPRTAVLYLALRPFQVNPPWQFLNWPGGTAPVRKIEFHGDRAMVNDEKIIRFITAPEAFGAAAFAQGDISSFMRRGILPEAQSVADDRSLASAAARYTWRLAPGESREVSLIIPFGAGAPGEEAVDIPRLRADVEEFWRTKVRTVSIQLPASAREVMETVHANLAWILINRDSAGIQPGSRSYERSWIRDGALTSAALLRFNIRREVRDYLEWYSRHLYPGGKVPCVVDRRGADPVPENDSNGEYLFAMRQYFLFSADTAFIRAHYPHIRAAAAWLDSLTAQRRSARYLPTGEDSSDAFFGLVPESISHEGYSAKPMHSYWDNFFTLRGYNDALELARLLGRSGDENWLRLSRDRFRQDLLASLERAMRYKKIDYLPGCVELGDFDATSTAIALYPGNLAPLLPQPQLQNTFDRYWDFFTRRRGGLIQWRDYTPYEVRTIGAFIRLDQPERAHALLDFFMQDRRPPGWRHWAEVVWPDPRTPRFIGDMPHTWVGSDFINSVRTMFLYEDEFHDALVIGAGLSRDWIITEEGVRVEGLPSYYGAVSYSYRWQAKGCRIEIPVSLRTPAGGIRVVHHAAGRPAKVTVNGRSWKEFDDRAVYLRSLPAVIEVTAGY